MRGLKRISQSGRAVCATIHQPSIAIFNVFDELLLLKQGGETVFFGPLGENSSNLIHYLERYDATQKIKPGENPASWMLTVIGAGSAATAKAFDYAGNYSASKLHKNCLDRIEKVIDCATRENRITFSSPYATSEKVQALAVLSRVFLIYFRSPHYNVTRVMVSALVGLLFGSGMYRKSIF
jgi:ABC-type multidrug transport system ATPase subunit